MNALQFGTSGLRGLSVDLVSAGASAYATAFARYLNWIGEVKAGDPIFIGRDLRDSSPAIATICFDALSGLGFTVCDCGTVPTPALALYSMKKGGPSMMVTGSHISADRNGIKFYKSDGEIDKADEAVITELAANVHPADASHTSHAIAEDHSSECLDLFYQRNSSFLAEGALAGLKVGVYQHSTVARDLIVKILAHYGTEIVPLGRSMNFAPLDTEAISNGMISLFASWTKQHGLDAIVSADGDGDRPLVTDERGIPVRGDLLGLMVAEYLKADAVATPVTSNSGIEALGFSVTRTRVGSPFVVACMKEAVAAGKKRVVGFEANGGLLLATACDAGQHTIDALPTRDCMLPILVALSRIAVLREPLSVIVRSYSLPFAASGRLENFPSERSAQLLDHLRVSDANLAIFLQSIGQVLSKTDIDGLRVGLSDQRAIHFRASGNAPEMRCYVEAATEKAAAQLLDFALKRLRYWTNNMEAQWVIACEGM